MKSIDLINNNVVIDGTLGRYYAVPKLEDLTFEFDSAGFVKTLTLKKGFNVVRPKQYLGGDISIYALLFVRTVLSDITVYPQRLDYNIHTDSFVTKNLRNKYSEFVLKYFDNNSKIPEDFKIKLDSKDIIYYVLNTATTGWYGNQNLVGDILKKYGKSFSEDWLLDEALHIGNKKIGTTTKCKKLREKLCEQPEILERLYEQSFNKTCAIKSL